MKSNVVFSLAVRIRKSGDLERIRCPVIVSFGHSVLWSVKVLVKPMSVHLSACLWLFEVDLVIDSSFTRFISRHKPAESLYEVDRSDSLALQAISFQLTVVRGIHVRV